MQTNRLRASVSFLLALLLLFSALQFSSCALKETEKGILQDNADAIALSLSGALEAKAQALLAEASVYESSGEILKDEKGNDIDMTAYIASLRSDAEALRTIEFDAYSLAILDDLYSRIYIGSYTPFTELSTEIVSLLTRNFPLSMATNKDAANELFYACYMFAVGDLYGAYVDEEAAKEEQAGDDSYVGIGVTVTQLPSGYLEVISVLADSPAKEAGIEAGDILVAVNGEDVLVLGYDETLVRVRGSEGSAVDLTFKRGEEERTVTVTRRKVINLTVSHKMLESGNGTTGYIRITQFEATTFTQFVEAVEALETAGATEFIFDVRSNPGGHLETILGILEYIVPDNTGLPLIRMQYTDETVSYYTVEEYLSDVNADNALLARYASAKNHSINARMTVLCDEYTASAGELFTSCLKDFGVAEVFGETTYGKGVGQSGYSVSDYYAYIAQGILDYTVLLPGYFRISAFKYSPPISDNYDGVGVVPHHTVSLAEEAKDYHITNIPEEIDNQLQAALAFVQSDTPLSAAPSIPQTPTLPSDPTNPLPDITDDRQSDGALYVVFGILLLLALALTAFLIVNHLQRKKTREKNLKNLFSNHKNDN